MKKSILLLTTIKAVLVIFFCILIIRSDSEFITSRFSAGMQEKLADLQNSLIKAERMSNKAIDNYEILQEDIAELAVYYLNNMGSRSWSRRTLESLSDILSAEGIYITDVRGHILSSSGETGLENLSDSNFSELFNVSPEHPVSNLSYYTVAGDASTDYSLATPMEYFVSCYMDEQHIVVVRDNLTDLYKTLSVSENYYSVLSRTKYGKDGLCFTVNPDGSIEYFPEFSTHQADSSEAPDIQKDWLENAHNGVLRLYGTDYFCTAKWFPSGDVWLFCAIPVQEFRAALFFVCLASLAVFMAAILILNQYARLMAKEVLKKRSQTTPRNARNKMLILLILCLVITLGASVYLRTLYFYTSSIRYDAIESETLEESLSPLSQNEEYGSEVYHNAVTIFTEAAASLIAQNPEYRSSQRLTELKEYLNAEHVLVYDQSGTVEASDLNYTGLTLSSSTDSLSGSFRWILRGEPILIQDTPDETYLNHPFLFSGAPIINSDGSYDGLVQLAIDPAFREEIVESASLKTLLSSFNGRGRNTSFAFTVESESKTVHSSNAEYEGVNAEELGLTSNELRDDYMGYLTLQGQRLLGACKAGSNFWAFVASYTDKLPLDGIQCGFLYALPALTAEILFFLILLYEMHWKKMHKKSSETAAKPGQRSSLAPEERIFLLLRRIMFIFSCFITLLMVLGSTFFERGSLYYFIFRHVWPKGLHIFSFTRVLLSICVVVFSMTLILRLLSLLISLLPSKQETILRMILSFVKYIGVLGALLYCLTLLGVPTTSLLASAGVLTIVLSMGAQSLVADILAGLFIIFEGTFKVGDMITVNDWHGQVTEIGIRNTTIRDLVSSDVKIMNNSTIKNVVNYSVFPSYCAIRIGVDYDTDLEKLEEIIEREKPVFKKNLPMMIGDLMYLGVDEFAESAIIIKFQAACSNQNDLKVKRALNREVKMMFDRNGIKVPFPQLVLSEREEMTGANLSEAEEPDSQDSPK